MGCRYDHNYNGLTLQVEIGGTGVSVDQFDVIDIISFDKQTGHTILTISDQLDWSDSVHHQTTLQTKFNAYLAFVESGKLLESYPNAVGRAVEFNAVFKFKPDQAGREFLIKAQNVIESAGFSLRYEIFAESYDN